MHEHDTNAVAAPGSSVYGTVMAALLGLAILYAIAAYVQWSAWFGLGGGV
jgi:hypothetical protein